MARWEPILEQVMRERAPRLLAYAAMLTGDDAEAHDVVQDALVRSFSRGRRFDHVNAAEAYVRRAIGSVVIDRSRKRRTVPRDPSVHAQQAAPASDRNAAMDVRRALRELGPRERTCIVLRFCDDLTVPQIAARLNLADGTVKRYLSDASARLAEILGTDVEWNDGPSVVRVVTRARHGRN
ncbi:MAG: RNA polymerase subunit sigma-24 [Actinobacteria bacterium HGW-Actinobacteria-8]|nr:MAG: RNA polymerase subunit sigma-24 [Actinobacteria bacterium HGW-Actinobacteria-8]